MARKWMELVLQKMQKTRHPGRPRWCFPLRDYPGWKSFAKKYRDNGAFVWEVLPEVLALPENKVVFDTSMDRCHYSDSERFARAYDMQHVVIFVLRAGTQHSKFADVMKILQDLLQGIMFCRKRGVQTFATPHILIFAEFSKPDAMHDMFVAYAPQAAPQAAPEAAPGAAPGAAPRLVFIPSMARLTAPEPGPEAPEAGADAWVVGVIN